MRARMRYNILYKIFVTEEIYFRYRDQQAARLLLLSRIDYNFVTHICTNPSHNINTYMCIATLQTRVSL